jgi:hypothetical protein
VNVPSDHFISIAGWSITFHQAVIIGIAVLASLGLWAILHFDRRRVVSLAQSAVTHQLAAELSRIAEALERIANRPADHIIAAAMKRQREAQPDRAPVAKPEPRGTPYSMLGG